MNLNENSLKKITQPRLKEWFDTFVGLPFIIEAIIITSLFLTFKPAFDSILKPISLILFQDLSADLSSVVAYGVLLLVMIMGFIIPILKPKWSFPNFRTSPKTAVVLTVFMLIYLSGYRSSSNCS